MSRLSVLSAGLLALALAACDAGAPADTDTASPPPVSDTASAPEAPAPDTGASEAERAEMDAVFSQYLPWNPEAEGIVTTESGLQYVVLSEGAEEGLSPLARDTVSVHYEGRLARTGETFDSSFERGQPAQFPLNRVIAGWTEGLQYMSVGDDVLFYIPADLAYGDSPRPGGIIEPGDDLVFRVQLLDVFPAPEPRTVTQEAWDAYTPWDSSREGVQTLESGIEYVVLVAGDGETSPTPQDAVVVHYEGRLDENGEVFDSSFARGEPAILQTGQLIPGWTEALQQMKRGDRWLIHIPAEQALGEAGSQDGVIPPNADINLEVELLDILSIR